MKRYNVPVRFEGAVAFFDPRAESLSDEVLASIGTTCATATTDNPDAPVDMIGLTEKQLSDEQLQRVLDSATVGGIWTQTGPVEQNNQATLLPVAFEGAVTIGVPRELTTEQQLSLAKDAGFAQVVGVVDNEAPFGLVVDRDELDGVIVGSILESAAVEGRWRDHEHWSVEERHGKSA